VHEQLYGSRNLSAVNFARYIEALIPELCRAGGSTERVFLYYGEVRATDKRGAGGGILRALRTFQAEHHILTGSLTGGHPYTFERLVDSRFGHYIG
jgi:hypothetical protein